MNLEELRKAYEAATPGEWEAGEDCDACYVWSNPKDDFLAELGMNGECDASFIALSHNAFPALLKIAECARALLTLNHTQGVEADHYESVEELLGEALEELE